MYRALIKIETSKRALLPEDELHHLLRVRRSQMGDTFVGLDGMGKVYLCSLEREKSQWYGKILEMIENVEVSPLQLTLGQALIKKDKFEWVIQKATELGVSQIVPLLSTRTELKLTPEREVRRMHRWRKILIEAVKQCGCPRIPQLRNPTPLKEYLSESQDQVRLVLDENGGMPLNQLIENKKDQLSYLVLIGPEGGWADQDRTLFEQYGVTPVHLGPRILRTETAPIAVLSILQYELGDLSRQETA